MTVFKPGHTDFFSALLLGGATTALCAGALIACGEGSKTPPGTERADSGVKAASSSDNTDAKTDTVVDAGPPIDTTTHQYNHDHEYIQYTGRIDFEKAGQATYNAPGVYVTARFLGDGLAVAIKDSAIWGSEPSFYDVVIDDEHVYKLIPNKDTITYQIPVELEPGEHTVVFSRRTEAAIGGTYFLGFDFDGEIIEPPPRPKHKIEFIGDSISVGSGNEAKNNSAQCSENGWGAEGGWGQPYHNARLAYGPVAARALDADYHVTAVSGIGLIRNYNSSSLRTMPIAYPQIDLAKDSDEWTHTSFAPDVIVIALGTNDFSPGDSYDGSNDDADVLREHMTPEVHSAAYIEFIDSLSALHPDAHIVGISSVMLGDGWPNGTYSSATGLKESLALVQAHYDDAGNDKVHTLEVTGQGGRGCGTHPNAEQHAQTALEVEDFIRTTMNW